MPRGDKTGPAGMGPMTGRAVGYCTGNAYPGFSGRRGFNRMGRGRGHRHWYHRTGMPGWSRYEAGYPAWGEYAPYPMYEDPYMVEEIVPEQEKDMLLGQAEMLKQHIAEIETRLKELEKDSKPVKDKKS